MRPRCGNICCSASCRYRSTVFGAETVRRFPQPRVQMLRDGEHIRRDGDAGVELAKEPGELALRFGFAAAGDLKAVARSVLGGWELDLDAEGAAALGDGAARSHYRARAVTLQPVIVASELQSEAQRNGRGAV